MPTKHFNSNPPNGQDNRLYLLQSGGIRIPVKIELFKHGGGIYLALVNHDEHVHIPLMASSATMKLELAGALYRIEVATETRDQGHISRKDGPR